MQPSKLAARLRTKLGLEQLTGVPVGSERIGLPASLVERQHKRAVEFLSVRMLPHELGQLWYELARAANRQLSIKALFQ